MKAVITKEEINLMPPVSFNKQIVVADTPGEAENAVNYLSQFPLLGFDTETRPVFQKGRTSNGTSLVQVASDDVCVLFRLNRMPFPPALERLLSDPGILKIGLSLRDDYHSLNRRHKFTPQGFIDLQQLVTNYGIEEMSLQKIYAILFHKRITKGQRTSNWEAERLTEAQQKYAALDAWACLKIYKKLCR
ncbi:3'-5' exonuclease domain protein [Candidatus Symbiothrix dinenymphae]|nr:3'-5' exonuclease domain protein [Candidatus Symbiothrix dinenymphae]